MGASLHTPYAILGVPSNADNYQLREAFRCHIHALKGGTISAVKYRYICRAYECLSDADKRKEYDEHKKWIYRIPITHYTLQQLAAEPILLKDMKTRLTNATLREINEQNSVTGHTALYCAARAGNLPGVLYLIKIGAEPDRSQRTQSTALHVSAFYGHPEVVRCLLECGADYRIKNMYGSTAENESYTPHVKKIFDELKETPFVQTAANQLDWLKSNIDRVIQHIDEQYFIHRQTLLHCASKKGYLELVQWLVEERGSNLDIVDINLNSALHLAAHGGHSPVVEYLLDRGADSLLINKWNMTAEQEGEHFGARICQIFQSMRQRNMFTMAIDGIDWWFQYHFGTNSPNTVDDSGTSLLYIACRYGRTSIAKWLLDHGANINQQLREDTGSTPLHGAAFHGHVSTVELLLSYGADVNIKNNYGATVFDEEKPEPIRILLEQYRRNLKNDKLMPVHVYQAKVPQNVQDEPIAKIHLRYDAKRMDLFDALPKSFQDQEGYFSIAGRPLSFETNETTVLMAVCCARYVRSKFIEIPLRLTFSTGKPLASKCNRSRMESITTYPSFEQTFNNLGQKSTLTIQPSTDTEETYHIADLTFSIATGPNKQDIQINIQYIKHTNSHWIDLPGCVCLFKTTYESRSRLKEPPIVSLVNEPNVRLYTLASPSQLWFTYDTRQKRLPVVEGIHAFFRHVDIIPTWLSLPADMFLAAMMERPLITRNDPVPCKYLELRKQNEDHFPIIAYHGTRIDALRSILTDGLVRPGTLVANGIRVRPPPHHIPLYISVNNIENFAAAIFVSPSFRYSSDPIYATPFEYEGKRWLPVLECSVRTGSYTTFKGTLPRYNPEPTDDMNTIEWRINDPRDIEINAIVFVIQEYDQRKRT